MVVCPGPYPWYQFLHPVVAKPTLSACRYISSKPEWETYVRDKVRESWRNCAWESYSSVFDFLRPERVVNEMSYSTTRTTRRIRTRQIWTKYIISVPIYIFEPTYYKLFGPKNIYLVLIWLWSEFVFWSESGSGPNLSFALNLSLVQIVVEPTKCELPGGSRKRCLYPGWILLHSVSSGVTVKLLPQWFWFHLQKSTANLKK